MNTTEKNIANADCDQFEILIDGYLDGEILPDEKASLEKHLTTCKGCREYMNDTARLIEKTGFLPKEAELDKEKKNNLWDKIQQAKNAGINSGAAVNLSIQKSRLGKYRYPFAAISAVIVLAACIFTISRFTGNKELGGDKITSNVQIGAFWKVSNVKGTPASENKLINSGDSIGIGQWITTNDTSSIELMVSNIGKVVVEPRTMLKIVKSDNGEKRIQVAYGTIDANIDANPRSFYVDMPSVTAVDLGCSYRLTIDSSGDGLVYVTAGKVSLESAGRETLVPEGKFCITKKDIGPGTPFRGDASPELKKALIDFDFGNCAGACVSTILKNAKKTDAVTLVSILPLVAQDMQKQVYAKVSAFVAPPKSFSYDSVHVPNLNPEDLDKWIEKIQEEVHTKIEKSMEDLQANLDKMNLDMDENSKDWEEYGKQWQKFGEEYGKEFEKNFDKNFKWDKTPRAKGDDDNSDTVYFDKEQFKKNMREMKKQMENMKSEFDKEQFKKEMEQSKEEMKRADKELKDAMKDLKKNLKIEIEKDLDSTGHHRMRIRVNPNNGDYDYDYDYDYDNDNDNDNDVDNGKNETITPDAPEAPETEQAPQKVVVPKEKVNPENPDTPETPETPETNPPDNK